jgi:hypothetical protein
MNKFYKSAPATSVMFTVTYTDGRTAYLWSEGHSKGVDDLRIGMIAREQQEQGLIPPGDIASIRRIR